MKKINDSSWWIVIEKFNYMFVYARVKIKERPSRNEAIGQIQDIVAEVLPCAA